MSTQPDQSSPRKLAPSLVVLLAVGAGLSVAGLYYNQPILGEIAGDLHATHAQIGLVPMLTQLGYAAGILLFAPLGDRLDRRKVIVVKLIALCAALLAAGFAPSIGWLAAASLAVGLLATTAQDFVPAGAALAPPEARGKTVGTVMTGLLLGILLSRFVSGATSAHFGWRAVFFGAAGTVAVLAAIAAVRLPRFEPSTNASYASLLRSIAVLARDVAPLRRAALAQALLSVAFSGFWSTLALALAAPPYHLGSATAGAFGLAGAAGALVAPLVGSIADKRGPTSVIRLGASLVAASFVLMALWQGSIAVLVVGTIAFDLGVQACLISHQTIVYSLEPAARSRLNAVLVSAMFFGMSAGAALASNALARFGWTGVTVLGAVAACAALVVRALPERAPSPATA
ncbi:MAG TPA: MFS transporter [Myxococcales bacterium]|jgi:predicted MFS family arabinose efflux permease|nr:MFS transporter [Myxococcales bacterium]